MTNTNTRQRIGLGLLGGPEVPNMVALAQLAEQRGFESVWVAETRLTRDAIAPCAAIAMATSRILIATGIVNVYTRGAVLTAASFVSLDEVSSGRIIMGLGPGSPLVLQPQGYAFDKPVTRLRETIEVVQALLRGEQVDYSGKTIQVAGAKLESPPPRSHIPLYLGVTGPKALELAGEKADGAMLNAFLPTAYVGRALQRIEAGARRAGRAGQPLDISGGVVVSLDENTALAKDRARAFIAMYLSLFPNLARETGLDEALLTRIRARFEADGAEQAAQLIDDAIVDALTASGSADEVRHRLEQYRAAGMQLPIIFPLGDDIAAAIEALGN
jgi:5,10-methylenetetrahydromethanopterin reductase